MTELKPITADRREVGGPTPEDVAKIKSELRTMYALGAACRFCQVVKATHLMTVAAGRRFASCDVCSTRYRRASQSEKRRLVLVSIEHTFAEHRDAMSRSRE